MATVGEATMSGSPWRLPRIRLRRLHGEADLSASARWSILREHGAFPLVFRDSVQPVDRVGPWK